MNSRTVRKTAYVVNAVAVAAIAAQVGVQTRSARGAVFAAVPGGLYLITLSRRVGWKER